MSLRNKILGYKAKMDDNEYIDLVELSKVLKDKDIYIISKDSMYYDIISQLRNLLPLDTKYVLGCYKISSIDSKIKFYSIEYENYRYFNNRTYTIFLENSIYITSSNINDVVSSIHNIILDNSLDNSYMITLYDGDRHLFINSTIKGLLESICTYSDMYSDGICITKIIVRESLTNKISYPKHSYANRGEGIHISLANNMWLCNVCQTKKYCILDVLLCWFNYSRYIKIPNSDVLKIIRKKYIKDCSVPKYLSTQYLSSVLGSNNVLIIRRLEDLQSITPDMTMSMLVCYVHNNHASLVIHESFLTHDYIKWLNYRCMCTFVQPIRILNVIDKYISNIIVADIECYRDTSNVPLISHIPMISCYFNGVKYVQHIGINCISNMLSELSRMDNPIVWMHNSGGYDSHLILEHAIEICDNNLVNPIEICDINGSIVKMVIHMYNDNTITICDSYKLLPMSLQSLSEDILGLSKLEYDIVNAPIESFASDKCLEYNKIDCMLLYKCLLSVDNILINSGWYSCLNNVTLSSYAKKIFYSRYYDFDKYPIYVIPSWLHNEIRKSYHGGRCELYKRGVIQSPVYMYDVNSMYPYAGCKNLPYGKPKYISGLDIIATESIVSKHFGFYDITIISSDISCKPLHGVNIDGKYIFGKFTNTRCMLFSEEILTGMKLGYKYKIHTIISYDKAQHMDTMFHTIYNLKRQCKNRSTRTIWKLILNSCCGFMGFKKYDRTVLKIYGEIAGDSIISSHLSATCDFTQFSNGVYLVSEKCDVLLNDTNVAIASAITSYARIYIHKIMSDIMSYGVNILYCDTDSIITDGEIEQYSVLNKLYIGDTIGMLKREYKGSVIQELCLATSKAYGIKMSNNYIVKIKGIDINTIVYNNGIILKSDRSEYMYKMLKQCVLDNTSMKITISKIHKSRESKIHKNKFLYEYISECVMDLEYNKGIIFKDNIIIPYNIIGNRF